jgi:hypothetical protein
MRDQTSQPAIALATLPPDTTTESRRPRPWRARRDAWSVAATAPGSFHRPGRAVACPRRHAMITPEQHAEIRRLYYGEHWKVGTIAAALASTMTPCARPSPMTRGACGAGRVAPRGSIRICPSFATRSRSIRACGRHGSSRWSRVGTPDLCRSRIYAVLHERRHTNPPTTLTKGAVTHQCRIGLRSRRRASYRSAPSPLVSRGTNRDRWLRTRRSHARVGCGDTAAVGGILDPSSGNLAQELRRSAVCAAASTHG